MPSDSQTAFEYLKNNLPQWSLNLQEIRSRLAEKHDITPKGAGPVKPSKVKSGSLESIHTRENPSVAVGAVVSPGATQMTIGQPTQTVQSQTRKRKPNSVVSGRLSGPPRYRTRNTVVIYYDSEIQKSFELLVRNIGMGRNLLRKGKMAAKIEAMTEASPSDEDSSSSSDNADPISAKIGYRHKHSLPHFTSTRAMSRGGALGSLRAMEASSDIFDTTDKALEKAQNLCERGAHQFLRDGDCEPELRGCSTYFEEATHYALAEVERYRIKEEKAQLRLSVHEVSPVKVVGQARNSYHQPDEIDLEVDDSEEEIDELALQAMRPPVRLTRRV